MQAVIKKAAILLGMALLFFFFGRMDSAFYQQPVGEVLSQKTSFVSDSQDEHGNQDQSYKQTLKVKVINRSNKVVEIENDYLSSKAESSRYRVHDQLLLSKIGSQYQVDMPKRDSLLFGLVALLLTGLYMASGRKKFSYLTLALVFNAMLFLSVVIWDARSRSLPVLALFVILAVLLSAIALVFVLGRTKQAFITWVSTCLATLLALVAMALAMTVTGGAGVHFETMSYVTQVPAPIFYSQAVIGVLGAVMDESGDIVAGLFGMQRESANRTFSEYYKSGLSIGKEILGTLTNVLFMIFIAETIPMVVLMLRNGNNWSYILDQAMNLGILQTVVSALGIVWAVPVTAFLAARRLTKEKEVAK
ncbi:YibE/F family protein [Fructobacillus sp. M2-14]|uniref:YibE/F family protein n=1 Tax=Fructobacillus broussonetiae TaxID=2713173 RepID=A0ABS5R2K5_9LACO|nr:YibE/F family protein [Fructobacillus broussonetiae]MBS9338789.1 YibE/F family protein [Fructobacillus broussonetiae]